MYEDVTNNDMVHEKMKEFLRFFDLTTIDSKTHNFPYGGCSGIYLLSESHFSYHSWPEYKYLAIDVFSCKKLKEGYINHINETFPGCEVKTISRGLSC